MKSRSLFVVISILFAVYILVSLVLKSVKNNRIETSNIEKDKLNVQAGWVLNGEFANVCSAIIRGFYDQENLEVRLIPGGPSGAKFIVATTAVAQDPNLDIGIDGDLVPLVRGTAKENESERLKTKAFASFWNKNPYGFLVREDSGIKSLRDFAKLKADGSRVKVGVASDFVLQTVMARYAGVRVDDFDFVTVGFDATPLIAGQVDAIAGYWTTQAYEIEKAGIPYKFLSVGELPGFEQPSMIAVATEATLKNKRPQLIKWLRATIRGSRFVIENPELAANDILDSRCGGKGFDLEQETWLISKSVPLFNKDKIGSMDIETIEKFTDAYHNLGQIPFVPNINSYIDLSILSDLYPN